MVDSSLVHTVCEKPIHKMRIKSIKKITKQAVVYNFHVPKYENYIANGIVTHNCYVARNRVFGNPIEKYINGNDAWEAVKAFHDTLGPKEPNQCDPTFWTYDIGESTDCLIPENIDNTSWYINKFLTTDAKPSFATKVAGARSLPVVGNRAMARVRVSVAPQHIITKVEKGTSNLKARIKGIQELYDRGYEVHLNFSPIIVYKGWSNDYINLLKYIDSNISQKVKDQIKCEVIFLTHSPSLHESNMRWIPEAEDLMWTPDWQESKTTQRGDSNVIRYRAFNFKNKLVDNFKNIIKDHMPYCTIRYIF
jgi:spore photoproduct lyase